MRRLWTSVVVVAKHAEQTITYAVESLLRQTVKPHEVLLVVDSLEDPTVGAVGMVPVRVAVNEGVGLGAARKTGIEASTGDMIAFIDADCVADERWVESLVKSFSKRNVMVQSGRTIVIRSVSEISPLGRGADDKNPSFLNFAPTMNFALRRELVGNVGNFDPRFRDGGEDLDFCVRLGKAGYKIYYNPNAKVYHLAPRYGLCRAWRDGRSRAKCLIKHGNAMMANASVALFHMVLLSSSLVLLAASHLGLALLVLIPSLIHRLYRAVVNVKHGNTILMGLLNSFTTYVSYISFTVSLLISSLKASQ